METMKRIRKEKLEHVEIYYSKESDEWESIRVRFRDGFTVEVNRSQIEAFLKVKKVVEDLQRVEKLRDTLIHIFGSTTQLAPPPEKQA